ncbi:MAG: flagellar basal body P-ring protein FlgI [Planctomycetes bacterium]|nr:flagellar basal body P-ring protein FlgI [Planctomycetota bacterium]
MRRRAAKSKIFHLAAAVLLLLSGTARAEGVRELITIHGAMPIPLEGIGIVTGLANTGDRQRAALQLLQKYLSNNNFDFDAASLATGNIAMVRVKAELPPFSRPGQRFPVSVTSINDARSLVGGELLACDLFDGHSDWPIARATGQVVIGAGLLTRGTVPAGQSSGAIQLATYPFGNIINRESVIRLNLNRPNWADASTIARQINQTPALNPNLQEASMFAEDESSEPIAYAKDAGQVLVRIPERYRHETTQFIATLLDVPVFVSRPAVIAVNRARNSIVVTGDVRVNNALVSIQDKMVSLRPETQEQPPSYTLDDDTPRNLIELDGPGTYADLQSLIDTMNAMGLTTAQMIAMFEELRTAGALHAEIINQ